MKRRCSPLNVGLVGIALAGVVAVLLGSIPAAGQSSRPLSGKAVVAALVQQIHRHQVTVDYQKDLRFVPSLLKSLDVNVDSQMLEISKTSLHADLNRP